MVTSKVKFEVDWEAKHTNQDEFRGRSVAFMPTFLTAQRPCAMELNGGL